MVQHHDDEPDYDFGFYGKMTWRRDAIIRQFEQRLRRPVIQLITFWTPRPQRDALMRKAKVILQIRANEEMQWVSSTRCAASLHFGRPIVAEPHANQGPWAAVVPFSAWPEKFYDDAIAMAADWRRAHADQLINFARALPPERCIGQPLRDIGVL